VPAAINNNVWLAICTRGHAQPSPTVGLEFLGGRD